MGVLSQFEDAAPSPPADRGGGGGGSGGLPGYRCRKRRLPHETLAVRVARFIQFSFLSCSPPFELKLQQPQKARSFPISAVLNLCRKTGNPSNCQTTKIIVDQLQPRDMRFLKELQPQEGALPWMTSLIMVTAVGW